MIVLLNGCSVEKMDQNKIRDLAFTLTEETQVPQELLQLIEEKKGTEMKLTFETGEFKYIVVGYGTQETGGYSISVDELYETANAIYIHTNLIGPAKGEMVSETESYPYVVIQMENLDKSVVFE